MSKKTSYGINDWNGPVPNGSFMKINSYVRMSTPEYFFLRMANGMPFDTAVKIGMELCGKYATSLTRPDLKDDYVFLMEPRTTKERIAAYLEQIIDTEEGKKALDVLECVVESASTPMETYLYMLLCMPEEHGGAGLKKPELSFVCEDEGGSFVPMSYGTHLAYDLFWREERVAVQYVGNGITARDFDALNVDGFDVHVVSDDEDADGMKKLVDDVAFAVSGRFPDFDKSLVGKMPAYERMTMTFNDLQTHAE